MSAKNFRTHYEEFELDLTPLLAIIMKLVPVLVISSSFLQLTQIDTDVPQVVKQAIEDQKNKPNENAQIRINIDPSRTTTIAIQYKGASETIEIKPVKNQIDLESLNLKLVTVKNKYPHVFMADLYPDEKLSYDEIVQVMDQSRKSKKGDEFTFFDEKSGHDVKTDFMFPEIVLANVFQ